MIGYNRIPRLLTYSGYLLYTKAIKEVTEEERDTMTPTKQEREDYNLHRERACADLGITKNQYDAFRRFGQELSQLDTDYCNGIYSTDRDIEAWNDLTDSVLEKIYTYIEEMLDGEETLFYYHQSDPRGCSLYLSKEPIDQNDYNRTSQAIY